jgi:uncharacterized protein YbgA (DUF1722 family)/uncharacterized protein YbbK (DUF523 family)
MDLYNMTEAMIKSIEQSGIPVGISGCLMGEKVRYDGGHKRSDYCRDVLSEYFQFHKVCPEMQIGLGSPRPIIRLVASDAGISAIQTTEPARDISEPLANVGDELLNSHPEMCGFVFTEKSPSCGLFRVKTYDDKGNLLHAKGRGLFAARLTERLPHLPVEESGRLNDPYLCENFILRVYTWHEWHTKLLPNLSAANLTHFWARYKFLVLAHNEAIYRQIGPLLANAGKQTLAELAESCFDLLMTALETPSTRGSNTNALQHMQGFLKKRIEPIEKKSLQTLIRQYKEGLVPLIVPLSMMRHLLEKYPDAYAEQQKFLSPYPDQLGLRNLK